MTGKKIGYIRVSTKEQNPESQLSSIQLDKKFIDYESGSNLERPSFKAMMEYVREDDTVCVHTIDRLSRNPRDFWNTIKTFEERKIKFFVESWNLLIEDYQSPMAIMMMGMAATNAGWELASIRERQRRGINAGKGRGVYKKTKKFDSQENIDKLKELLKKGKPRARIAKEMGISRFTIWRYLKETNQMHLAKPAWMLEEKIVPIGAL